jgi:hypothetical protein
MVELAQQPRLGRAQTLVFQHLATPVSHFVKPQGQLQVALALMLQ